MHTTCLYNPLNLTGRLTSIILTWHSAEKKGVSKDIPAEDK